MVAARQKSNFVNPASIIHVGTMVDKDPDKLTFQQARAPYRRLLKSRICKSYHQHRLQKPKLAVSPAESVLTYNFA